MAKLTENLCRASRKVERVLFFGEIVRVVRREFLHTETDS